MGVERNGWTVAEIVGDPESPDWSPEKGIRAIAVAPRKQDAVAIAELFRGRGRRAWVDLVEEMPL